MNHNKENCISNLFPSRHRSHIFSYTKRGTGEQDTSRATELCNNAETLIRKFLWFLFKIQHRNWLSYNAELCWIMIDFILSSASQKVKNGFHSCHTPKKHFKTEDTHSIALVPFVFFVNEAKTKIEIPNPWVWFLWFFF